MDAANGCFIMFKTITTRVSDIIAAVDLVTSCNAFSPFFDVFKKIRLPLKPIIFSQSSKTSIRPTVNVISHAMRENNRYVNKMSLYY